MMDFPVSTKVEKAWYVNPELWSGDGDDPRPVVEAEGWEPLARDATMTLMDGDLEETGEVGVDGGRHYKAVSLRGALLARDEETLGEAAAFEGRGLEGPLAQLSRSLRRAGLATARLIEAGRTSPVKLAALSFSAGVGMTLLGVILAL